MQPNLEHSLELLQKAETAANANSVPTWISILVMIVFLTCAVWYLTAKLGSVSRGQNNETLFEKVFGGRR